MKFHINGCRVVIGFWFAAVLAFSLLADQTGMTTAGLSAIVVHESGHLFFLHLFHVKIKEIRCGLFDINIVRDSSTKSYFQEIWISLAGPLANLCCAIFLWVLHPSWRLVPIAANLLLALFNLLPIDSLDGGQAFFNALCICMPTEHAAKIQKIVSLLILFPLAVFGFVVLLRTKYNFTLLFVSCYLILCLLLKTDT